VNREHAETHLRLVAEAELRRAAAPPWAAAVAPAAAAAALYDLPSWQREVIALRYYGNLAEAEAAAALHISPGTAHALATRGMSTLRAALETGLSSRVAQVARVLTAVRALDPEVADQVVDDFVLSLAAHRADLAAPPALDPEPALRSGLAQLPLGMLTGPPPPPGGTGPAAAPGPPGPVVLLDQVIGVRGDDVRGQVYLLSYARTAPQARLTVITRAQGEFVPPGIEHNGMYRPAAVFPVDQFTVTDDHGAGYATSFRGRRGRRPTELAGEIILDPAPPPDARWLELSPGPGEPTARIGLHPEGGAAVTVLETQTSPGEHLLHQMATRLLLLALAFRHEIRLHPAVPVPEPFGCVADGLGDAIAALQAVGALSPLSPVPGQLAALCAVLDVSGHGITARPARQLPGPWLSLLAHYRQRKRGPAPGRDGCAGAAVALPGLDGIRLALLGLHNADGRTFWYGHADGMTPPGPRAWQEAELDFPLRVWVRDDGGRWHATRAAGRRWSGDDGTGLTLRLEVVPPLSRTAAWIEVTAAGTSAQARVTLPLRWR
jgi:sigma-70-like protein